jgi:C4-dicarboxylate-specific signal transduction histidine kinase
LFRSLLSEARVVNHPPESDRGSATILVVEDHAVLRSVIEQRLRECGYRTAGAGSGGEALGWLAEHTARLIVLDYMLPDMLGDELVRQLQDRGVRVPFVVATAHGNEALAVEMMKCGARDYLIKGYDFLNRLPTVVEHTLAQVAREERLQAAEEELRRSRADLQRTHDELEDRVRQRTAELAEAYVRLRVETDERRRSEERTRQHEAELAHVANLNALGEMVAEVAHELNQPLSAICTYAQATQRLLQSPNTQNLLQLQTILQNVREQAERAAGFVRRLGQMVAKGERLTTREDLNGLIRQVEGMFAVQAHLLQVAVRLSLSEPLPPVAVDRLQIEQVLVNLIRNAFQALDEARSEPREMSIDTAVRNGCVEVAVCDTGAGLPPGETEQIFRRFFTTKPGAIGMGLSISRTIIENHGGRLWAARNTDRGTTVRFTLPVYHGDIGDAL